MANLCAFLILPEVYPAGHVRGMCPTESSGSTRVVEYLLTSEKVALADPREIPLRYDPTRRSSASDYCTMATSQTEAEKLSLFSLV